MGIQPKESKTSARKGRGFFHCNLSALPEGDFGVAPPKSLRDS